MRRLRIALILAASSACFVAHRATDGYGVLRLTIADGETNSTVPARVTLRDGSGGYLVPDSALAVFGDCGKVPFHNWAPASAALQTSWGEYRGVRNPYKGSTDFYTAGTLATRLRPGRYWMRVEKGPEYGAAEQEFVIAAGQEQSVRSVLRRWIDLPAEGWYSSDDHLHIPRPSARLDPALAAWMQAEDIHVANLLQMGLARDVHLTPQRAFGPSSVYESGRTLLVGGQENPRTHVFGHSIILGGRTWIDFPQAYLRYDLAWREAHRQGALAGYAHLGMAGAQDGLALWGQERLIDFIEVINLGFPYYQSWYDTLNLGARVAPTAGTDYPCLADLPGRERFYAKLDGALAFPAWIDAVRRGRTFVTNGPALEFSVGGSMIGDELALEAPGAVKVRARVRFDPSRDRVDRLEIVQAGQVVATARQAVAGEIALDVSAAISASTWLAARISGEKVGERPADSVEPFARYVSRLKRKADANFRETLEYTARPGQARISAAHTAPIYIVVHGTPSILEQAPARKVAKARLDLLDDLAARLEYAHLGDLARFPGAGDGIAIEDLRRNRADLVRAIQEARVQYRKILQPGGG
ncbi:MAG: CehA/McbA family metallohydrolase [Acidobacteria bacterium]|nr:CehA/McbA family metallohydrolase [Acidobacteriota bacterium]